MSTFGFVKGCAGNFPFNKDANSSLGYVVRSGLFHTFDIMNNKQLIILILILNIDLFSLATAEKKLQ